MAIQILTSKFCTGRTQCFSIFLHKYQSPCGGVFLYAGVIIQLYQ